MKQKKMLALTLSQLKQLYRNELPEIVPVSYTHLTLPTKA